MAGQDDLIVCTSADHEPAICSLPPEVPNYRYMPRINSEIEELCNELHSNRRKYKPTLTCPNSCAHGSLDLEELDYQWPTEANPILFSSIVGYRCSHCQRIYVQLDDLYAMEDLVRRMTDHSSRAAHPHGASGHWPFRRFAQK